MAFGHSIFTCICSSAKLIPNAPQNHPKVSQQGTHWTLFYVILDLRVEISKRWFRLCETSVFMVGGGPGTPLVQHIAHTTSNVLLVTTFSRFVVDLVFKRGPRGGPTKDPRTTFSATFSTLPPWGAPGRPRVAKRPPRIPKSHQNDTNMPPKPCRNDSQNNKKQKLKHRKVSNTHPSTGHFVRARLYRAAKQHSVLGGSLPG